MSSEAQNKVETMVKNGITQLVILEGKAPTQHNPEPVNLTGTITAPSLFIEKRKECTNYDKNSSHCKVSKTEGTIELVVNEQSVCNKFTVKGQIYIGKKFASLGINNSSKSYAPTELAQKLRLLRSIFPSKGEHATIVATLNNLVAKVNRQIEESDDKRGNTSGFFKQTVSSNMPEAITLNIPLIEGEEPVNIEVSVILEAHGNDIICFLESVDGQEQIDAITEKLVLEEVEKIKNDTTIIYY